MNYWKEVISESAEQCGLPVTDAQLDYMADAVRSAHENYSEVHYTPRSSDRVQDIERGAEQKLKRLQAEFDAYRDAACAAVGKALKVRDGVKVTIDANGEVLATSGRTWTVQNAPI